MKYSNTTLPSNRKFGYFFSIIFLIIAIYSYYIEIKIFSFFIFILSFVFLIITYLRPNILLPLNRLWMNFGLLLSYIVSPIILGAIFFLIFTPTALITKLVGRDELSLKFSKKGSNWKNRKNDTSFLNRFKNQF